MRKPEGNSAGLYAIIADVSYVTVGIEPLEDPCDLSLEANREAAYEI